MSATTHDHPLVAIIDSDDSLRAELRVLLGAAAFAVEVFNSAEDYFLKRNESHSPHCIVLDVRLPGMSGLDLQSRLANIGRKTPFVFLTADNEARTSVRAMKAGAIDYLIRPFQHKELLDAVNRGIECDRAERLPKQIAGKLGVCTHTARVHSSRIMYKMGARSIVDLVRMSDQLGHAPNKEAIRSHDIPVSNCCGAAPRFRKSFGSSTRGSRGHSLTPSPSPF
jgi:FixJ family two-component response regulator